MDSITIQVQSVLYHNAKQDILRAVESLANAVAVARRGERPGLGVTLSYGDASSHPLFSEDEWGQLAQRYGELLDIRYRFFEENTGHAKGQNLLAASCERGYIMILNPDVVVNPHIFERLLAPFSDTENPVGIAEARQVPLEHPKEYDPQTGETNWATGACFLCPLSVFREVGGFDHESFFMYCDDVDFSWRVRLAGYRVLYVPGAPVFHAKTITADGAWKPTGAEKYYSAEAALLLAYKWGNSKRVSALLSQFGQGDDETQRKAAAAYLERTKSQSLPVQMDPEKKIASFTQQGYGYYRYLY